MLWHFRISVWNEIFLIIEIITISDNLNSNLCILFFYEKIFSKQQHIKLLGQQFLPAEVSLKSFEYHGISDL